MYKTAWESVDYGAWNRLRLSRTAETELTIQRRGQGTYRILLCGRLLGTTRDKSEERRRKKALVLLREWCREAEATIGQWLVNDQPEYAQS